MNEKERNKTIHGILLSKTPLADDDVLLNVFTKEEGSVSIFARKLARSQKKIREIDFFRIIEFSLFRGRNSYSLRGARTTHIFPQFSGSYKCIQTGFDWKKKLSSIVPEGQENHAFFQEIHTIFLQYKKDHNLLWDALFRVRCLAFMGLLESTRQNLPQKEFFALSFLRQKTEKIVLHAPQLTQDQIHKLHTIVLQYEQARIEEIV